MSASSSAPLRVALLGCGVVGSSVARLLVEHSGDLAARIGAPLELVGIAVRRLGRDRSDVPVDPSLFTTDAAALVSRADIVVEVIGGIEPTRDLLLLFRSLFILLIFYLLGICMHLVSFY